MNLALLHRAISMLRPGASYSISGSDPLLSDVNWSDQSQTKPTQQELDAWLAAYVAPDPADIDRLERALKALALLMRDYTNALKSETRGLALLLINKGTITAQEAQALAAYTGSGAGGAKTVEDLKQDYKAKYDTVGG